MKKIEFFISNDEFTNGLADNIMQTLHEPADADVPENDETDAS